MRVMIAGGGTGGHVYPGRAIYNALRRLGDGVDVLFVGAKSGVENRIFEELGLPHVLLAGRGVRGTALLSRLVSPFVFLSSMVRATKEILSFNPDVVVGTGGFASVAVVAASVVCGKKRVLQEQNSVPGMANRVLSRFAHLVLLSYKESRGFLHEGVRCDVIGNPLRVKPGENRKDAFAFFELDAALPTVLVFGGSRGAHAINEAARGAVKSILSKRDVQFVFLTGAADYTEVNADLEPLAGRVRVLPFLEQMDKAYQVADLAVSRAGASAVFELAAFGVPSIFVPYPYAADDHQARNVSELAGMDAAVIVPDRELDAEALEAIIFALLDDVDKRGEMARKLRAWAPRDADVEAANRIREVAGLERSEFAHRREIASRAARSTPQ
jgi:UDP-N-acetylglucosamine--N-acetylmuramyl-(pentapeptide) pyrophosphoryl-undecaprenol N-acetylglucosamine transferase